jgi:hypothetical protein
VFLLFGLLINQRLIAVTLIAFGISLSLLQTAVQGAANFYQITSIALSQFALILPTFYLSDLNKEPLRESE